MLGTDRFKPMRPAANQAASPDLATALDRLWARFLPEMRERVSVLESAAQSLAAGTLTVDRQEAAHDAAHKLAGVLGTFNLARGTDLARDLELLLETPPGPGSAPQLMQFASELRALIETRK